MPILRKARKRIETLFSQLCNQFMIRRNYAKTFDGFSSRFMAQDDRADFNTVVQQTRWKQAKSFENSHFLNAQRVNSII